MQNQEDKKANVEGLIYLIQCLFIHTSYLKGITLCPILDSCIIS